MRLLSTLVITLVLWLAVEGKTQEIDLVEQEEKRIEKEIQKLFAEFNSSLAKADYGTAEKKLTTVLKYEPRLSDAFYLRGRVRFQAGKVEKSIEDFDQHVKLSPSKKSRQWERGIALYYAEKFEDGAQQFEIYQTYHDNDVENSAWRFLCVARKDGLGVARKNLLPIRNDRRVPMMQIYEMYRGQTTPEKVLEAAHSLTSNETEKNSALFYAHLYIGLLQEVQGDAKAALRHVKQARSHKIGHYMWDVANVHVQLREKSSTDQVLPSWNDSVNKSAITEFVRRVSEKGGAGFVPPPQRIAVFDNDGTLWAEKPVYFQALYIVDRVKELAPQHPEWKTEEPFASLLKGDLKKALAGGEEALVKLMMATHANLTVEEFSASVRQWLESAKHPQTSKPFTSMAYQPMLELLDYLKKNEFKVFIVSGGGIDFLRVFAEELYGIPPERVVGSSIKSRYEIRNGKPMIVKLPEIDLINDKAGKPVGIQRYIGRRPIFAFGNSDGDFQMLEWTTSGQGSRLGLLVHHDDEQREWAYDRESSVGRLNRGLDEAAQRGWKIISMKNDWKSIFPDKR